VKRGNALNGVGREVGEQSPKDHPPNNQNEQWQLTTCQGTACSPAKYSTASRFIRTGPMDMSMKVTSCINTLGARIRPKSWRMVCNCREKAEGKERTFLE